MENRRFRVGSVAVLFTVVLLCVSIFAALTVTTALADEKTAQRYGQHVYRQYACENLGQQWLAQARAYQMGRGPLPENTRQEAGGSLSTCILGDAMELNIRLDQKGNLERWSCTAQWQPEDNLQLWQ